MDKLLEAIAILLGWGNKQEAANLLLEKAQPVAQVLIDKGHGIEREQSTSKITTAEKERDDAKADLKKVQGELDTLKKEKPDVALMQSQHETALREKDEVHQKELEKVTKQRRDALMDRDKALVKGYLVEQGVASSIADNFVDSKSFEERLDWNEKNESKVFQAGTRTPLTLAAGQKWHEVVGEEIKAKVPTGGFVTAGDEGTGASGHGSQQGGGKGGKDKANVFENIRKDVKAKTEAQSGQDTATIRRQKFGDRQPART